MKTVQLVLNFQAYTYLEFSKFTGRICTKMENNPNFPTPMPSVAEMVRDNEAYLKAIKDQVPGDINSTLKVSQMRKHIAHGLKFWASYVVYISKNDVVMASTSGFEIKKESARPSKEFSVKQLKVSGSVELSIKSVKGSAYIWQYSPDPFNESSWVVAATTTLASTTVTGLQAGVKYWFQVALVIGEDQQPFCDPKMLHVV
jgi:hypothetical protein